MKKIIFSIGFIMMLTATFSCISINGQRVSSARVVNTDFDLKGNQLIITYDIENYDKNEIFFITAVIFYESGERISAKSLSGDIKENVKGGKNKTIIWDLERDRIELKGSIYVEITASPELVAEEEPVEDMAEEPIKETSKEPVKSVGLAGPLVQSIVLPGLGNARIARKPYWVIGIIGYGSVATSYWFNKRAASSYDNYLSQRDDPEQRVNYYNDADTEKQISVACGIAAGVIWAADLTLLVINHKKHKKRLSAMSLPQTTFGINYDPVVNANMLTLRISF
ncbi:MAG: hypothetical protein JSV22_02815 [Bacteroidales bacterium]|nr:MAG: hypothetical protein JSV22_02815 [Bacteroidales bacterium]